MTTFYRFVLAIFIAQVIPLSAVEESELNRLIFSEDLAPDEAQAFNALGIESIDLLKFGLLETDSNFKESRYFSFLTLKYKQYERELSENEKSEIITLLVSSIERKIENEPIESIAYIAGIRDIKHHDIDSFLKKISSHEHPRVRSAVEVALQRRKTARNPLKLQTLPKPQSVSQSDTLASEPTFAKKPSTLGKKPSESEAVEPTSNNPFPYWIFIIGGVVVVGLVVLLRRK